MIPLPQTFIKKGWTFEVLQRIGDVVLVSKKHRTHKEREFFEVHVVAKCPEHTFPNGNTVPARESLRCSEQFGTYAWAYDDMRDAWMRMKLASANLGQRQCHLRKNEFIA